MDFPRPYAFNPPQDFSADPDRLSYWADTMSYSQPYPPEGSQRLSDAQDHLPTSADLGTQRGPYVTYLDVAHGSAIDACNLYWYI
jgi:hypothetical protein